MEQYAEKTSYSKKCSQNNELKNEIGENIKNLRQQNGWSQEYLGYFAQINQDTMSRIESGKAGLSLLTLVKLTTAMNKPINSVFNEQIDQL